MADVPLWPSLVAVIVAVPAALPVTSPLELTVATLVFELAHVTTRPVNGLPLASFGVAVSCVLPPGARLADEGLTTTLATGTCVTVTLADPLCPSLVAVTVVVPGPAPVTAPVAFTLAIPLFPLVQVMARPLRG
jgi:hypothetical protein